MSKGETNGAQGPGVRGYAPNPELVERPRRRRFTAEYKLQILREVDRCTRPGESGAVLRREGHRLGAMATPTLLLDSLLFTGAPDRRYLRAYSRMSLERLP